MPNVANQVKKATRGGQILDSVWGFGVSMIESVRSSVVGEMVMEHKSLWRKVVGGKYGVVPRGWCSEMGRGTFGVSLWRYIRCEHM